MRKRSRTEDRVPISPLEPQMVLADEYGIVKGGSLIIRGQKGVSVALDERLLISVTVLVEIVMLVAFMYWVYVVSLITF